MATRKAEPDQTSTPAAPLKSVTAAEDTAIKARFVGYGALVLLTGQVLAPGDVIELEPGDPSLDYLAVVDEHDS